MLSARDSIASITRLTFFYDFFFDKISFFWGYFAKILKNSSKKAIYTNVLKKMNRCSTQCLHDVIQWQYHVVCLSECKQGWLKPLTNPNPNPNPCHLEMFVVALLHAPILTFLNKCLHLFWVTFFLYIYLSLWIVWKRFESDKLRNSRIIITDLLAFKMLELKHETAATTNFHSGSTGYSWCRVILITQHTPFSRKGLFRI